MEPDRSAKPISETSPLIIAISESDDDRLPRGQADSFAALPAVVISDGRTIEPPASSQMNRILILVGVLVIGWSYGLDGLVRNTYQSYAASSFGVHSLVSTINVLRSVVAAAVHLPVAKFADLFGRFELIASTVVFYLLGTALESNATTVGAFILGAVLYQIGYTSVVLLVEVIIADITSMRSRVVFSYVPAVPFLVNSWVSGDVANAVIRYWSWRWGIGMWGIIYAISAVPLLVGLYRGGLRHALDTVHRGSRLNSVRMRFSQVYRQLDIVGICLAVAALTLVLVPLTIAEGQLSRWQSPSIIISLIVGCLCIPAFVYWEDKCAKIPIVPGYLLRDRGMVSALVVRCLLNFAWAVQGNYLYTVLIVAFDFSVTLATQITAFFTFFGVISGLLVGLVIYRARKLKIFIIIGTLLFLVAFGLLAKFDGGASASSKQGMIGAQVLIGLAAGFCAYPTQASVQAATRHEHVSAMTGVYLATFNIGTALGTCVSGAIWSESLLPTLQSNLAFQSNSTLAEAMYQSPFEVVSLYPVGTEIRSAIIASYSHVQWLLCVTGLCLCIPMVGFALYLSDPRLSSAQSQPGLGEDDADD